MSSNNRPIITNASRIVPQVTVNRISEEPIISNDPNVRGVIGNEVPASDGRQTNSILADLGVLSSFVNIASIGGPGSYNPECSEEDLHENPCVECVNGRWQHWGVMDPCSEYFPVRNPVTLVMECDSNFIGCRICGPCYNCSSIDGVAICEEADDFLGKCLRCNNDISFCEGGNPTESTCTADLPQCCNGQCIGLLDCTYTGIYGQCVPGCNPWFLDCATCELGVCVPGGACGECQKCDLGVCVPDPDGYDDNGDPCSEYVQNILHNTIVP